ncbi:MAG: tetratricopeptide repeat protein [Firmicutes bacterium]|nr:tetratricopeptide repeat protein [Bacillota bacterium]
MARYEAAVERYRSALLTSAENPDHHYRLGTALYALGVLREDSALIREARQVFTSAFELGADLVACELAFRATELCLAVLDGGHGAAAQLARIHQMLLKAKNRVLIKEAAYYRDWVFLVLLCREYERVLGGADESETAFAPATELSPAQCDFLERLAATKQPALPTDEVLHFLRPD